MSWRRKTAILSIGIGSAMLLSSCGPSHEPFPSSAWLVAINPEGDEQGAHFVAMDPENPELTHEIGLIDYDQLSYWGDYDAGPDRVWSADGALSVSRDNQWHVDHNLSYIPDGMIVTEDTVVQAYPVTPEYQDVEPVDFPVANIPEEHFQSGDSHVMAASFEQTSEHPHHLIVSVTDTQPAQPSETKTLPTDGSVVKHWRFDVESPNSEPEEVVTEPEYVVTDSRPYWRLSDGYPINKRDAKSSGTATTSYGETSSTSERQDRSVWAQLQGDSQVFDFSSPRLEGTQSDILHLELKTEDSEDQVVTTPPLNEVDSFEIIWVKPPYDLQSNG